MLKTIAAAVVAALFVTPATAQLPRLDVEVSCRAMGKFAEGVRNYDQCMKAENEALAELKKIWSKYSAAEHSQCIGLTKIGNLPSYVEVLTCLQINRAAKDPQTQVK